MIHYQNEDMTVAIQGDRLYIALGDTIVYQKTIYNWFKLAVLDDPGMSKYMFMDKKNKELTDKK